MKKYEFYDMEYHIVFVYTLLCPISGESTPGIGCHYDCKNKCDGDLGCLSECLEGCSNPRLQRRKDNISLPYEKKL